MTVQLSGSEGRVDALACGEGVSGSERLLDPDALRSGADVAALRDEVERRAAPLTLWALLWLGGWAEL